MKAPTAPWPTVNDRVGVRLECCERDMSARVEDSDGHRLTLAAPTHACDLPPPPAGRRASVHWITTHAVMRMSAVVVETRALPLPVWVLDGQGEPERVQRRRYVRVPTQPLPLLLRAGDKQYTGLLLDLSEGGLRCSCDGPVELAAGEPLIAWLKLAGDLADGANLALSAEVVRVASGPDRRQLVACSFVDVPKASADRLRQYVFDLQRSERRRQAGLG